MPNTMCHFSWAKSMTRCKVSSLSHFQDDSHLWAGNIKELAYIKERLKSIAKQDEMATRADKRENSAKEEKNCKIGS